MPWIPSSKIHYNSIKNLAPPFYQEYNENASIIEIFGAVNPRSLADIAQ